MDRLEDFCTFLSTNWTILGLKSVSFFVHFPVLNSVFFMNGVDGQALENCLPKLCNFWVNSLRPSCCAASWLGLLAGISGGSGNFSSCVNFWGGFMTPWIFKSTSDPKCFSAFLLGNSLDFLPPLLLLLGVAILPAKKPTTDWATGGKAPFQRPTHKFSP